MYLNKKYYFLLLWVLVSVIGCQTRQSARTNIDSAVDRALMQTVPETMSPQVDPGLPQTSFEQESQGALTP